MAPQPEEDEWVRLARAGDRAAFANLVDLYWDRLRRWLYALTGRHETAEDLTQEAFFRAWLGLPKLQADNRFRVWLFRIARNCFLDGRKGPRGVEETTITHEVAGRQDEPIHEALVREGEELLRAAVARLSETYRGVYLLWTQEDTARWRVCKSRQFLLKELAAYLDVQSK